ncbi:MAG: PilN domain-containing protein [Solirubrobacteraceae bacterium]
MKAVNLIPGERRRRAGRLIGRSGGGALIVLGLFVGLVALAIAYGSARHQISDQAGETASLNAQTSAVQAHTGRLTPYTSFVSMAEKRMQTVSQLVESRFDWSHALHELGRVLPAGTALDSLHGTIGSQSVTAGAAAGAAASTSATSSTPPGAVPVFTLSGCATSQSEVAQTLQRLRLMNGVSEVELQSSTSSDSSSGGSGGCPGSDPSFAVQVSFAALPAAPALSAPAGTPTSSTTAAHTHGATEQISAHRKGTLR